MKRMSDVFELPIDCDYFEVAGYEPVKAKTVGNSCEADDYAAHAINHVDKLADALEVAIDAMIGDGMECYDGFHKLVDALKAYRGEK
jgi:hypothetical protein